MDTTLDIFKELDVEPTFVQTYPDDYDLRRLNQVEEGEVYKGKPTLGEVSTFERETDRFDDTGMVIMETVYTIKLGLIDDEKEIILDIPVKLKNDDDLQTSIHPSSTLNKLIIAVVRTMGGDMGNFNTVKSIKISKLRDMINKIELMKVKIVERTGGSFLYNSFEALDPSKDYDGEDLVE